MFTLKQYLLENCSGEIALASDTTFHIGYYADGKKKYSISSELEALSLAKNGIITLWVNPHKDPLRVPPGKKRKGIVYKRCKTSHVLPLLKLNMQVFFHCFYHFPKVAKPNCSTALSESEEDGDERGESTYDACLWRLRKKRKLPEFKLRCWARMMVRKI